MNKILVFDIETVPDTEACFALTGYKSNDVKKLREEMEMYHLKITDGRNPFLRQLFHKIIVIGLLVVEVNTVKQNEVLCLKLKEVKSGSSEHFTEKQLIKLFFDYFTKSKPRLVSFNGRTFDLPVLRYRAMKYGIPCNTLYNSGDKWNNYINRYSPDWHCDLLEVLSDYGSSARIKMSELCVIFGLPGKLGVDGSQVVDLYDAGKIQEISDYCETDVLNTYLIYLRWLHHQGKITTEGYNLSIDDLCEYITSNEGKKNHFREFNKQWVKPRHI